MGYGLSDNNLTTQYQLNMICIVKYEIIANIDLGVIKPVGMGGFQFFTGKSRCINCMLLKYGKQGMHTESCWGNLLVNVRLDD